MTSWSTELEGSLAGPYIVEQRLGSNAHAATFAGRTTVGEKRVELKFLSEEAMSRSSLHGLGGTPLLQEYRIAMHVGPSHVSRHIYAGYGAMGTPFLARELAVDDGQLNADRVWSFPDATSLVTDVAEAVIALHDLGLEGPTLTPANLEIFPEGGGGARRCRLRDLSWLRWSSLPSAILAPLHLNTLTPEQAFGEGPDVRSDVFNLGRLYYVLLTGASPFEGYDHSVESLASLYTSDEPLPTRRLKERRADLFEEVDMFLVRALHRNPDVRPESVKLFLGAVMHLVEVYEASKQR